MANQIIINYKFGSVPRRGYEKTEEKRAGGMLGGHITMTIDGLVYGFTDENSGEDTHIFPDHRNPNGYWEKITKENFDKLMATEQMMKIYIPIVLRQKIYLIRTLNAYIAKAPYDYSFFGMRCMSAMYDLLSRAGIVPYVPSNVVWLTYFYPKPFGLKMKELAKVNRWKVTYQKGRYSRIWDYF